MSDLIEKKMRKINSSPKRLSESKKKLLVLDMDETLIHSSPIKLSENYIFRVFGFFVYERPYLQEFLKNISEYYSLGIWSAGADNYVAKIIDKIIPPYISLDFVWGRSKCVPELKSLFKVRTDNFSYMKELRTLEKFGYNLKDIVLVDDSRKIRLINPKNSMVISPFTGEEDDKELIRLENFLLSIRKEENFQKIDFSEWELKVFL